MICRTIIAKLTFLKGNKLNEEQKKLLAKNYDQDSQTEPSSGIVDGEDNITFISTKCSINTFYTPRQFINFRIISTNNPTYLKIIKYSHSFPVKRTFFCNFCFNQKLVNYQKFILLYWLICL